MRSGCGTSRLLLGLSVLCGVSVCDPESCDVQVHSIRLTQTPAIASADGNVGRLEACVENTWGTFTLQSDINFWPMKNIHVACLQLGFSGGGLNSIPPSHIPFADKSPANLSIHYELINCEGHELSLSECATSPFGDTRNPDPSAHHRDVFIVCQPNQKRYSDLHVTGEQVGDIRLRGSPHNGLGAVEILTDQLGWTGICPDGWGSVNARVVCQSLGYDFSIADTFQLAADSMNRSVYDASCSATPSSSSSRVQAKFCSFQQVLHPEDCAALPGLYAGVQCSVRESSRTNPVRLFGNEVFDQERALGIVEVLYDDRWGVVCENHAPQQALINAKFLCSNFFGEDEDARPARLPLSSLRKYESRLKPLWVNQLTCPLDIGIDFDECDVDEPVGFSNCSSGYIMAVDCGSTTTERENNGTAIIVGVVVTVLIFAIVILIFGKIFYDMFQKRQRSVAMVDAGSFALTADLSHSSISNREGRPACRIAAVNAAFGDSGKEGDGEKEREDTNNFDESDEKLTNA